MNPEELSELKNNLYQTKDILEALSSKVRQDILLELAAIYPKGLRIGEIKLRKCITRPTMSFHMKLLCKAELIRYYKEGTKNFYYLAIPSKKLEELQGLCIKLKEFSGEAYDPSN
ncbi:MAG: helix-turn-helix domain-containing protein [Anaeroplasmataceae bacterium]|nr:helix-turn-helix domain-containing protein [Anaeroplasmataceae bacterium]